jgi:tetratricopeptide (TPR) repeat protein
VDASDPDMPHSRVLLCSLLTLSCAGANPLSNLVGGGSGNGATQSTTSQSDAAYQNAEIEQAEKDRVAKLKEDKKQKVLEARSRADADPKSPDAVGSYADAVLESDQLLRRGPDKSFDWSEQAEHAAGLTQKVASGVPGAQKKAHFYTQSGLLHARLDQKDQAINAFDHSLKEAPGDLRVVEYLLGMYKSTNAPVASSEALCKRTSRSMSGAERLYQLINVCVNEHPKRSDFSVPSDLAKMLPWASGKEVKDYKRWLGEGICKDERMKECQRNCRCDPAQVVCSCKERCKTDANACMVPYLD